MLRRISRWMGSKRSMTHVNTGNTAPVFSLKGLDGKDYSLPTLLKRGPVVAAFFKISCPVCQFTFPFLERLYKRYGGGTVCGLGSFLEEPGGREGDWWGHRVTVQRAPRAKQ